MIYIDDLKYCYYPILMSIIVDYKEQVLITRIKANMECFVCHVPLQEQKNLTKTWPPQIHKSIWSQFEQQSNNCIK